MRSAWLTGSACGFNKEAGSYTLRFESFLGCSSSVSLHGQYDIDETEISVEEGRLVWTMPEGSTCRGLSLSATPQVNLRRCSSLSSLS